MTRTANSAFHQSRTSIDDFHWSSHNCLSVSTDPLGFAFAPVGRFRCASIVPLIPADRGNVTKYFGNKAGRCLTGRGF